MKNKFGVRDLINAGAFSLLIVVATFIGGMIGFLPILMPLVPFVCGLLSGIIFMLYATKIKSFGMVLIMGIVLVIVFMASGHGIFVLGGIVMAILADLLLKRGNYQSVNFARLSYTLFSVFYIFLLLPIYISRDAYKQNLIKAGYGKQYADQLMSVLPDWSLVPIALLGCLGAFIGCTIGIKILKKHFAKAGMI